MLPSLAALSEQTLQKTTEGTVRKQHDDGSVYFFEKNTGRLLRIMMSPVFEFRTDDNGNDVAITKIAIQYYEGTKGAEKYVGLKNYENGQLVRKGVRDEDGKWTWRTRKTMSDEEVEKDMLSVF
jgi:hypothetical protein